MRRNNNLVADYLAKSCFSKEFGTQVIVSLSSHVKQLILNDNFIIVDV